MEIEESAKKEAQNEKAREMHKEEKKEIEFEKPKKPVDGKAKSHAKRFSEDASKRITEIREGEEHLKSKLDKIKEELKRVIK